MKTTLFILLSALFTTVCKAQEPSCDTASLPTAECKIYSKLITNVNGTATYRLTVFANDTVYIDSLRFASSYFSGISSNSFNQSYLLPGDSAYTTISVSYNSNSLPYYYKTIILSVGVPTNRNMSSLTTSIPIDYSSL